MWANFNSELLNFLLCTLKQLPTCAHTTVHACKQHDIYCYSFSQYVTVKEFQPACMYYFSCTVHRAVATGMVRGVVTWPLFSHTNSKPHLFLKQMSVNRKRCVPDYVSSRHLQHVNCTGTVNGPRWVWFGKSGHGLKFFRITPFLPDNLKFGGYSPGTCPMTVTVNVLLYT